MLFARVVLVIQLLALAGLGLAYFVQPHEMANLSGMLLMSPARLPICGRSTVACNWAWRRLSACR